MTTGNRTYGTKTLAEIYSSWAENDAFCYSKVWNGGDMPKTPKVAPIYAYVTRIIRRRINKARWPGDKQGRKLLKVKLPNGRIVERWSKRKKEYEYIPVKLKIRLNKPFWDPQPRRRSTELHSYEMQINKRSSETMSYMNGSDPVTGIPRPYVTVGSNSLEAGSGYLSTQGMLYNDWTTNDDLKLLDRLKTKLQGSDFNLSVFLGEGHQTLGMIADSAIRIRKALHHLHRGDIAGTARSLLEGTSRSPLKPYSTMGKAIKSTPQTIANNWLELQYGWLPLLNDVNEAAQLLAHQLSAPLEMAVKANLKKSWEGQKTQYVGLTTTGKSPNTSNVYRFFTSYHTSTRRDRLTVYIKERPSAMAVLGLTDPLPVAWELTPWSFVADWFIPIGQWLDVRGLSSIYPGEYVKSTMKTGRNTQPRFWSNSNGANTKPNNVQERPNRLKWEPEGGTGGESERSNSFYAWYTRSGPLEAPPLPLPSFKPLNKVASWQHCANAIALLTQQFGSSSTAGRTAVLPEIRRK